ncbi:nitrogen regulation protein NR(I) [Sphingomonas sp. LaA6.9]|uniref:nitrogen regulation protein NR(I) n=1 Tax=Sphingomonas sp. LaA6.9 TaxID=2919914 RepID=UPI001F4FFD59|nr:nitrogen regulation protein NR(I) [Sphingomonas sp. LaA6.9]MCJ8157365.1 nitrogen regulation protein NR(I) [Sphingomonas sp. LaA6.9]
MSSGRILVVDDDAAIRTVLAEALRSEGHTIALAASIAEMEGKIGSFDPELLITDVILPDGNGLDQISSVLQRRPDLPVIVLSAQNTLATAVRATEQGAFEYLPKPFDLDELCRAVGDGLRSRANRGAAAPEAIKEDLPLIGRSPAMQDVYRTIARVVSNELTVLVFGESGTGKELVARAIHDLGPRRQKPFVAINMAAIPRDLIESELFGHERGAFTGAQARTAGKFELAQGGTLFLDEIGDMPMEAQTRLLRVLQQGEFTTVGGARPIRADVRIIAATHKDLPALIAANGFREDLYYRLNVVPVTLPPLRERVGDIPELARHFLDRAAQEGLSRKRLGDDALARLATHGWPGNVRELENLMRRLAALSREELISARQIDQALMGGPGESVPIPFIGKGLEDAVEVHLSGYFASFGDDLPPDGLYDRVLAEVEAPLLRLTLAAVRGNQLRAADLLGINRNTLRKKLTDHGIDPSRVRRGTG